MSVPKVILLVLALALVAACRGVPQEEPLHELTPLPFAPEPVEVVVEPEPMPEPTPTPVPTPTPEPTLTPTPELAPRPTPDVTVTKAPADNREPELLIPTAPTDLEFSIDGPNLRLTWMTPDHTGGQPITRYDLRVRRDRQWEWAWTDHTDWEVLTGVWSVDMGDVSPGYLMDLSEHFPATIREIQVRAFNGYGRGPWSDILKLLTVNTSPEGTWYVIEVSDEVDIPHPLPLPEKLSPPPRGDLLNYWTLIEPGGQIGLLYKLWWRECLDIYSEPTEESEMVACLDLPSGPIIDLGEEGVIEKTATFGYSNYPISNLWIRVRAPDGTVGWLHRFTVEDPTRLWELLVIAPEDRCSPYDRDDYPYFPSIEQDIVESVGLVGIAFGPYENRIFDSRTETDIDHIVAISEAHDSGLCAADDATRKEFASDLFNLTLASPSVNRYQKSDNDVAEWLPDHNRCWYVYRTVQVRLRYGLTVDQAEVDAIERVMSECTWEDLWEDPLLSALESTSGEGE